MSLLAHVAKHLFVIYLELIILMSNTTIGLSLLIVASAWCYLKCPGTLLNYYIDVQHVVCDNNASMDE